MKKILCSIAAALLLLASAHADEGMWLLPLLEQLNIKDMQKLGCRLSADQIYSINHSSIKDAIVIFGGGCTGEIISDKGLLVTNHHCGYSSIQQLSSDEHNYLENGFWAMNNKEEIPAPGLSVTFLVSMQDVTDAVRDAYNEGLMQARDSSDEVRLQAARAARSAVMGKISEEAQKANPNCRATVQSFYNDNVWYLIVYKSYNDVRFVGAPPASVGKFGGDTDNWMWPRHTGDFSMFRVYAGKDNEPADYSEDNVPYRPAQSLAVSLKGISQGDFTMILGYPGRTQRYQTVSQLNEMLARNDISIAARTLRQDIMQKWMKSDPSIRLKYADKYASSSNYWKKWQGEKLAIKNLRILENEQAKEEAFLKWANKNKKRKAAYANAIEAISQGVEAGSAAGRAMTLLSETVTEIELVNLSYSFLQTAAGSLKADPSDTTAALEDALLSVEEAYGDYWAPLDKEEAAALLKFYRENAEPDNYLDFGDEDFATMDIDAYVDDLFENSVFTSKEKLREALPLGFNALVHDPANQLFSALYGTLIKLYYGSSAGRDLIQQGSTAYTAGLLEWQKGKSFYPDANFTMRLTYGTVCPYSPKDALTYNYFTTIEGVMEKEDPDNYEFIVPEKLKKLYQARDYGRYAMPDGNLPCCFLTNNDITGGNSGSPVLNADGQLIGLAFDGNWESMSSDELYDPKLQRCICVDIRYVLFMVDKFGGAGYLLKEMNIVK